MEKRASSKESYVINPWLCPSCRSLVHQLLRKSPSSDKVSIKISTDEYGIIYASTEVSSSEIDKSSGAGCSVCYRFNRLMLAEDFDFHKNSSTICTKTISDADEFFAGCEARSGLKISQFHYSDSRLGPCYTVSSTRTGSEESCRVARNWIERCNEEHDCFNGQTPPKEYPKRLLDLDHENDPSDAIRIIETDPSKPNCPYITLSYCWGTYMPLKLTRNTIQEFKSGISVSRLPKTFQDAVKVCGLLGVRYLWIDSLCIVQEHKENSEWSEESVRMAQIYGNALCTIAASSARDASEGLFRERHPDWLQPHLLIKYESEKNKAPQVNGDSLWDMDVERSILSTRAWAFQERVLSPRVLFFSDSQVYWECREMRTCERLHFCEQDRISDTFGRTWYWNLLRSLQKRLHTPRHDNTDGSADLEFKSDTQVLWRALVKHYSECKLTIGTDKLVGISGLAKMVSAAIGDDYVAGLLKSDLHAGLCWFSLTRNRRLQHYQAPSFSWASIEGGTWQQVIHMVEKDMVIQDMRIQHKGDKFGVPFWAFLRVEAYLRPFASFAAFYDLRTWGSVGHNYSSFLFDHKDTVDKYQRHQTQSFYCAWVGLGESLNREIEDSLWLILEHYEGVSYRRIGLFTAGKRALQEYGNCIDNKPDEKAASRIPCEMYDKNTGRHTFLIT